MKILVYGAGAIGGYLGTNLASIGHDVTFITRPHSVSRIQNEGVPVIEDGERLVAPVKAFGSLAEAMQGQSYEYVILAVKSYHLPGVSADLATHFPDLPKVLITQNGINVEHPLVEAFGRERILVSSITAPVNRCPDDVMEVTKPKRGLGIAPLVIGQDARKYIEVFDGSKVLAFGLADYRPMKWSKAMFNHISNASSAITGMSPKQVYAHDGLFKMEIAMLREFLAVMRAAGIRPIHFAGTPTPPIAYMIRFAPLPITRFIMKFVIEAGRGDKMPSFYQDLAAGKRQNEVLYHHCATGEMGEKFGSPAPLCATLGQIVLDIANGKIAHSDYLNQPEKLLSTISEIINV